jgi:hypothetical protein
METLTPQEQPPAKDRQPLASEAQHWYRRDGSPCYEVEAKKGGMRAATLADARKLDLLPSVTLILNVAAKPGLEIWKAQQLLQAALTLPKLPDETLDDYAARVIEDSKSQSLKAREKGTELHTAIEQYIQETAGITEWDNHILAVASTLLQHGIDIKDGRAERSFSSKLGYGGKIDYAHDSGLLIDFKTTAKITPKTKPYDEHLMQCAAYGYGLFIPKFRALNVFVGIEDCEVRVFEHEWDDLSRGFSMFQDLLSFWKKKNNFGLIKSLQKKP